MEVNFGGVKEKVVTREEFSLDNARKVLENETIAVLGYGSQAPGQSQNLRDNGFNVIVGQREGTESYDKARADGWIPNKTLFSLEDAAKRGTIVAYLLSDAGQVLKWEDIRKHLEPADALYFSHGFGINFPQHTKIVPPPFVDVIMVAPKGTGASVREDFLNGKGINSSYAVQKDHTRRALDRSLALGMGIGSGYLFKTTFRNEVVSDHFGERAVLLGELKAIVEADYEKLRYRGQDPKKAFIDSSEQLTQVILPLIGQSGVLEIYKQAQKAGELGTVLEYRKAIRKATESLLNQLYKSVTDGVEAKIALAANSDPNYRKNLTDQLTDIDRSEMWKTGTAVRNEIASTDRDYGLRITNWPLAGVVIGAMESQFQKLITEGHSPSEAYNETVEELTQSLNRFYQRKGISNLLAACSTTAQVGALEWGPKFKDVIKPLFMHLALSYGKGDISSLNYSVTTPNMLEVGTTVRTLRPHYPK